jgi:hypothetical protein
MNFVKQMPRGAVIVSGLPSHTVNFHISILPNDHSRMSQPTPVAENATRSRSSYVIASSCKAFRIGTSDGKVVEGI